MPEGLADPIFWMNVTTSANWHRSPVGIVRVEQEVRRHLTHLLKDRLQPIVFTNGKFVRHGSSGLIVPSQDDDDFWPEPSFGSSSELFEPLATGAFPRPQPMSNSRATGKPRFRYGDVLVTMGLDWDHPGLLDEIRRVAEAYNLTVITCCYDLIPILFPQYCVGDVASWFKDYLINMTWSSDGVLCISENTRRDYLELVDAIGLPRRATEVIRLGSSLPPQAESAPISAEVDKILKGRFFLFVSTIERRKNHELLYRAYHLMRQQQPHAELPKLVFVGMEGWGVGDLMSDIKLDPLTRGDIVILPHVSDSELVRLYERCDAFLYPSLYEGWGLPIAEALQLGRPVLASNTGSIPEVGGDLVRYLDPWSPRAWADELVNLANGLEDLKSWSQEIGKRFHPYQWSSAAETVVAMANQLRAMKPSTRVLQAGHDLLTFNGLHYGDKIIYTGSEGIVCHGPYLELPDGAYEITVEIEWFEPASGSVRLTASHNRAATKLAVKEMDADLLEVGRHTVVLSIEILEAIYDFQLVCEVECDREVRLSIGKIEMTRQSPPANRWAAQAKVA